MFSAGHLIWIALCALLIGGGLAACFRLRPSLDRVLTIGLVLALVSEVVKFFSVIQVLPVVVPVVSGAEVTYQATGDFTPYLRIDHFPFELCSIQIFVLLALRLIRDPVWRRRLLAFFYGTASLGGLMGILLCTTAAELHTAADFFNSPRPWQYFLYHSIIVTLGVYTGFAPESGLTFRDVGVCTAGVICLDVLTFYGNSMLNDPVYLGTRDPVGVTHVVNFFSSYQNPLGMTMTEVWQWMLYLVIRAALAILLLCLVFLPLRNRKPAAGKEAAL